MIRAEQRGEHPAKPGRQRDASRRANDVASSRARSAAEIDAAAGRAMMTRSFPAGQPLRCCRNHSRRRRFTRLRTTAPPTRRLTVSPRRGVPVGSPLRWSATRSTTDRDAIRVPSRAILRKSFDDRRRSLRRKRWLPPAAITSTASRPPDACGPLPVAGQAPCARPASSCGTGTRASAAGGSDSADRCAS